MEVFQCLTGLRSVNDPFVEIVAKSIGGNDEEHIELLTVAFVHANACDINSVGLKLTSDPVNITNAKSQHPLEPDHRH